MLFKRYLESCPIFDRIELNNQYPSEQTFQLILDEDLSFIQCKYLVKYTNLSLYEIEAINPKRYSIIELKKLLKNRYKTLQMENSVITNILNRNNNTINSNQQLLQLFQQSMQHYNNQNKLQFNKINQQLELFKQQLNNQQKQLEIHKIGLNLYWNSVIIIIYKLKLIYFRD